jgi:Sec-independent protein translocase protein TatA
MIPGRIGTPELILFACSALLSFGKQLPDIARGLGEAPREYTKGFQDYH